VSTVLGIVKGGACLDEGYSLVFNKVTRTGVVISHANLIHAESSMERKLGRTFECRYIQCRTPLLHKISRCFWERNRPKERNRSNKKSFPMVSRVLSAGVKILYAKPARFVERDARCTCHGTGRGNMAGIGPLTEGSTWTPLQRSIRHVRDIWTPT